MLFVERGASEGGSWEFWEFRENAVQRRYSRFGSGVIRSNPGVPAINKLRFFSRIFRFDSRRLHQYLSTCISATRYELGAAGTLARYAHVLSTPTCALTKTVDRLRERCSRPCGWKARVMLSAFIAARGSPVTRTSITSKASPASVDRLFLELCARSRLSQDGKDEPNSFPEPSLRPASPCTVATSTARQSPAGPLSSAICQRPALRRQPG